jgi:AcrR family transcriptional regulator
MEMLLSVRRLSIYEHSSYFVLAFRTNEIAMPTSRQAVEAKRRNPRQARAEETVSAILEAAAQILEGGGLAAFTTNAVAERAGVSIGTLYQYFADKNALLRTLAEREQRRVLADVARALRGEVESSLEGRVRAVVRSMVNAFHGRQRARKAVIQAVLTQGVGMELLAPVAAFVAERSARFDSKEGAFFPALGREQVFVLSRALMGVIRSAVLEEAPFFRSRTFEDEVVRLLLAYLAAITAQAPASTAPG